MKADESFAKAELQLAQRIQEMIDPDCLRRVSEIASQAARQIGAVSQNIVGADYYTSLERATAMINAEVSAIAQEGFQLPFPENVHSSIVSFQAAEMARIDQMAPTAMLEELQRHLTESNYSAYMASMSEALKSTFIDAADISYLKGVKLSEIGMQVINAIDMPKGLISKLDDVHVFTANRLAKNDEIRFNLETKQFVLNDNQEKTSTVEEMNSLSSAAAMFDSLAEEKEYVTEEELIEFMNQLEKVQSRASRSRTGEKIDTLIRDVVERIGFDRELFYHSRTMADANACPYTDAQMLTAPAGLPGPGRFNNPGRSYYYFADTLEGTIAELRKHDKKRRIQTVEIKPVKKITMIDLSGTLQNAKTFLRYLRFPLDDQSAMPRVYLIPNYVSDCCRAHDIEGVKYYGSKKYSNYVTWNADYFQLVRTILESENNRSDSE